MTNQPPREWRAVMARMSLKSAAIALLEEIELVPGGYDYRPYYRLRASSQLNDPCGRVIDLIKAVKSAGGKLPEPHERWNKP